MPCEATSFINIYSTKIKAQTLCYSKSFGIEAKIQGDRWKIGKADFVNLTHESKLFDFLLKTDFTGKNHGIY